MANVTISGKELLSSLTDYLEHLEACRDFIERFAVEGFMIHSLAIAQKKTYPYDFERLRNALESYEASKNVAVIDFPRGTVTRLLESIDNLRDAEKLVSCLATAVGYYDPEMPQHMQRDLAHLMGFDDSE